jgi:hypothetical protein
VLVPSEPSSGGLLALCDSHVEGEEPLWARLSWKDQMGRKLGEE